MRSSGDKRRSAGRETWLTPYGEAWKRRWGEESEPPYREMAGAMREAHERHGTKLVGWWERFLAATERAEWARPARFVQGLGQWSGSIRPRAREPAPASPIDAAVDRMAAKAAQAAREGR